MTDNLEQLEKDWPTKFPKDLTTRGVTKLNMAMAAIVSISAIFFEVLMTIRAKSQHAVSRLFPGMSRIFWILLVWVGFLVSYRRIKAKIVNSGTNPDLLPAIQYIGATLLFTVSMALMMIVISRM